MRGSDNKVPVSLGVNFFDNEFISSNQATFESSFESHLFDILSSITISNFSSSFRIDFAQFVGAMRNVMGNLVSESLKV